MPNTSATGGPLVPNAGVAPNTAPLSAAALYAFLQGWLAPIIGLPGNLVRIYDQAEPPSAPEAGSAWAAVKVTIGASDAFPFVGHNFIAGGPFDVLQRHEVLELLASFYDLGSLGLAQDYCLTLRDGLSIAQNLEPLILNGMGFVSCGDPVTVPVLMKQRWMYRMDLSFGVRRQVTRTYPVLDLAAMNGTVATSGALPTEPIKSP